MTCTVCGKHFDLGEPFQARIAREDGQDACAECVGCADCGQWPCQCELPADAMARDTSADPA